MSTSDPEVRVIVSELRKQGWEVDLSGRDNKWKARPPDPNHEMVVFSSRPANVVQVIRYLRQSGFVWPPPKENGHAFSSVPPRISSTPFPPTPNPDVQNGSIVPVTERTPPPPERCEIIPSAVAVVDDTPMLDRLFQDLKEAKEYARMAVEHLAECEARRDAAERNVIAAEAERHRALDEYRLKKAALDRALDPLPHTNYAQ